MTKNEIEQNWINPLSPIGGVTVNVYIINSRLIAKTQKSFMQNTKGYIC